MAHRRQAYEARIAHRLIEWKMEVTEDPKGRSEMLPEGLEGNLGRLPVLDSSSSHHDVVGHKLGTRVADEDLDIPVVGMGLVEVGLADGLFDKEVPGKVPRVSIDRLGPTEEHDFSANPRPWKIEEARLDLLW